MRILLTNDDGLRAPGIEAMYDALVDAEGRCGGPLGEAVVPIAPKTVQSATSHGVTFHQPLMVEEVAVNPRMTGVAVDARPADCVKLAVANLWPERFGAGSRPDLLVSGMNAGANAGINVIYSGTVAAALEAAFLGIPAIAVSLYLGRQGRPDFAAAARVGRRAIDAILADGLPEPHSCLSVNIPITAMERPNPDADPDYPIRVCRMNTHGLNDRYERRVSPGGDVYYWAAGYGLDFRSTDEGSDVQLLMQGCVTVTPLRYDLTKKSVLQAWKDRIEGRARGR